MLKISALVESIGLATALSVVLSFSTVSTRAAEITVTSQADSGAGSLREALAMAANGDTIDFSLTVPATISLTSGQLVVSNSLTILGPGVGNLALDGKHVSRVFYIAPGTTSTIANVAITNGSVTGTNSGGGIFNDGSALTVSNCYVSGNFATGIGGGIYNSGSSGYASLVIINSTVNSNSVASVGSGGGIANYNATLTLSNSLVSGNSAYGGGGIINNGFYGPATLIITDSTLSGNNGIFGGGIYNYGYSPAASGTVIVRGSTLSGNSVFDSGGGMFSRGYAVVTVNASTFNGNSAYRGGGIYTWGLNGNASVVMSSSTVSGNWASSGGGIYSDGSGPNPTKLVVNASTFAFNWITNANGHGAAIYNDGNSNYQANATVEIGDTILRAGFYGENLFNSFGTVISDGFNLSSDDADFLLLANGDQFEVDPMVGPLQDNGGPTFTHALLAGSPAIDQGRSDAVTALSPNTDQRGRERIADFASVANAFGGDGSDIGAFEVQLPLAGSPVFLSGMQKLSNGAFQFGFTNTPDARFTVLGTTNADVGASNWIVVGLAAEMAPGQFQFTDPKAVKDPQRFYRVRSP